MNDDQKRQAVIEWLEEQQLRIEHEKFQASEDENFYREDDLGNDLAVMDELLAIARGTWQDEYNPEPYEVKVAEKRLKVWSAKVAS